MDIRINRRNFLIGGLVAYACGFPFASMVSAEGIVSKIPKIDRWLDIARSEYVIVGEITKPPTIIQESPVSWRMELSLNVVRTIKGSLSQKTISVLSYGRQEPVFPHNGHPAAQVVLFLVTPSDFPSKQFYLLHSDAFILSATSDEQSRLESEIANQKRISHLYNRYYSPTDLHLQNRVRDLIQSIANSDDSQPLSDELEKLNWKAVPAIVRYIDDRRPLKAGYIQFENNTVDHLERYRTYQPIQVVDLLTGLLGQITGINIGGIQNGGDESHRQVAINGWRTVTFYGKSALR